MSLSLRLPETGHKLPDLFDQAQCGEPNLIFIFFHIRGKPSFTVTFPLDAIQSIQLRKRRYIN